MNIQQYIETFGITQCPPAFARGACHKQVRESSRQRVRALQRAHREYEAQLQSEVDWLNSLTA